MPRLIFPLNLYSRVNESLLRYSPRESGAFLLAHEYSREDGEVVITAVGMVEPDEKSWNLQGEHSLEPTSAYINRAVVIADDKGSGVLFTHTHPSSLHPPRFSKIDEVTNSKLLPNLSEILPGRPIGSLVLSKAGVYGVVVEGRRIVPISMVKANGMPIYRVDVNKKVERVQKNGDWFGRQSKALGVRVQDDLRNATVGIIGAGGTGSAVATLLARMGIKMIYLLDFDHLEASNLSRMYGARPSDLGKPKVRILKRHLESFSVARVEALTVDITKEDVRGILAQCDIIFGCTDNLTSRALLNDIALQYYIPLIDVGCRIHLNPTGAVDQAVAKVQVVTPDHACLWCTGTLEGKAILQESLSPDELKKLEEEGYYEPTDKQPSVVSLTSLAASIAVNKFLGMLGVFGEGYPTRTQVELRSEFMISDTPPIREGCVCNKRRGVGDSRSIAYPTLTRKRGHR